jgi:hypothetical protein
MYSHQEDSVYEVENKIRETFLEGKSPQRLSTSKGFQQIPVSQRRLRQMVLRKTIFHISSWVKTV